MIRNIRYSLRSMRKHLGLTITVLVTLALGVGANTAIFTVDYATLLASLPYPQPNQLMMVWSKVRGGRNSISVGDFLDWKNQNTMFQDINAWTEATFNMATAEQPDRVEARTVTPGYFQMLGLPFFLGRSFLPEEGEPGHEHEVILTHKMWKRLGGDPQIIGRSLRLNSEPYTVVGVLPEGFFDRGMGDIAVPLAFTPDEKNYDFHSLVAMGRLKPGVSMAQAQADMDAVTARIAQNYPRSNRGRGALVEPLKNDFIPPERIRSLWLLLGAVGFVLLIACVNVANLLLARGVARQKEMAVRASLGAAASTLFGQLLTESLILALAGGALGIGVGQAMLNGFIAVMPPNTLPSEADLSLNIPILLFTLAATILAGLVSGCIPAWYAAHTDPADALREGSRSGTGSGRHKLRRILVIGEFALALALLAGAGLTIHSFWNLTRVDLGVSTDHTLTFYLPVPDSRSNDPAQIVAYYRRMLASIESVPGVTSASVSTATPLEGLGFGRSFILAGGPDYADRSQRPETASGMVTPGFFKTYGIRLEQGRFLSDQDEPSGVKVAMVSTEFVRRYLAGKDPLRQRVIMDQTIPGVTHLGPPVEWEIVGVFHNIRNNLREDRPEMLMPFWQSPWPSTAIGVRTAEDPASMVNTIAAAVHRVDPEIALDTPRTMEQVRDDALASDRFTLVLFLTFAVIALILAATGIYGIMTFSVAQRSHEIALRMALGSTRSGVVGLIIREGLLLALAGLSLGLAGAYFIGRAMQTMLYGVAALDVAAFSAVAAMLVFAALVACIVPARRAASTDPMQVLRTE
jgi:putative ABC transport system permease protein